MDRKKLMQTVVETIRDHEDFFQDIIQKCPENFESGATAADFTEFAIRELAKENLLPAQIVLRGLDNIYRKLLRGELYDAIPNEQARVLFDRHLKESTRVTFCIFSLDELSQ